MKKSVFLLLGIFLLSLISFSQVSINTDSSNPDPDAMLDVKSTSKGVLIPRMTTFERLSLGTGTAEGLMVYDTETGSFWFYDIGWKPLSVNNIWSRSLSPVRTYLSFIDDQVGIGDPTPPPNKKLYVIYNNTNSESCGIMSLNSTTGTSSAHYGVYGEIWSDSDLNMGAGLYGNHFSVTGSCAGVRANTNSPDGFGVFSSASSSTGVNYGVYGQTYSSDGYAIYGKASSTTGTNYAVHGLTSSPDGWSAYFEGGKNYFEGSVGIGTTSIEEELHVQGDGLFRDLSPFIAFDITATSGEGGMSFKDAGLAEAYLSYSKSKNQLRFLGPDPLGSFFIAPNINHDRASEVILASGWENDYNFTIKYDGISDAMFIYSKELADTLGPHLAITRHDGYVGIGTSSPSTELEVNGTATATAFIGDGSGLTNVGDNLGNHTATQNIETNGNWLSYDSGNQGIFITSTYKVGIGTTSPLTQCEIYFDNISTNDGLRIHNYGTGDAIARFTIANSTKFSIGVDNSDGDKFKIGTGQNVSDNTALTIDGSGRVGIGITTMTYPLMVVGSGIHSEHSTSENYGTIGNLTSGVFGKINSYVAGNYGVFGDGVTSTTASGTGYTESTSLGGVKGYNYRGNAYTFGVGGFKFYTQNRSAGCLGSNGNGTIFGMLSYQNSGGVPYGGYFTSSIIGPGKDNQELSGIGLGSWGDLFGADIHGKVYGTFTEGENYALYSNGTVFKNALDVHLQKNNEQKMSVLYTNVSTDVTVQTSGFGKLSDGKCTIEFDENFRDVVSEDIPVIVTITPMGRSNGIYLAEVTKSGFSVIEDNEGKSKIDFTFIAIGRRAGYEHPELPREVTATDYLDKLHAGFHNDADTETDAKGLYYQNGELAVGTPSSNGFEPPAGSFDGEVRNAKPVPEAVDPNPDQDQEPKPVIPSSENSDRPTVKVLNAN